MKDVLNFYRFSLIHLGTYALWGSYIYDLLPPRKTFGVGLKTILKMMSKSLSVVMGRRGLLSLVFISLLSVRIHFTLTLLLSLLSCKLTFFSCLFSSLGDFCVSLLSEPKYCDLFFPRLPVKLKKEIDDGLAPYLKDKKRGRDDTPNTETSPKRRR